MRWLLFLSRLSFICGICFLIALCLALFGRENSDPFSQTIIMIGFVMGLVVVPFTNLSYLGIVIGGKKLGKLVPAWLVLSNILFLFALLFYIFYVNDPYYNPK